MNLLTIKVKCDKRLKLDFADAVAAGGHLGRIAADRLRHRVDELGFDAQEQRLPDVGGGRASFSVSAKDPRFNDLVAELQRQGGYRVLRGGGYDAFKARSGRATHRGSSLTGKMWDSLTVAVRRKTRGGNAWFEVRVYFAGGERTATGYIRHRDKARLAQYSKRAGNTGFAPAGAPDFLIMEFSAREMKEFARYVVGNIQLFEPRPR